MFFKIKFKNGIGPVVAVALLLVIAVLAVVIFQSWFGNYSSSLFSNAEIKGSGSFNTGIEDLIDNVLYFRNAGIENLTIDAIKIDSIDCNISLNMTPGVNMIDVSVCIVDLLHSNPMIVIVTDKGIISKEVYFKNIHLDEELILPTGSFISKWNVSIDIGVSGLNNLKLPLQSDGIYNFFIDWGDGTNDTITSWDQIEVTHNYGGVGEYIINITGLIDGFAFNAGSYSQDNQDDGDKLIDVLQWGNLKISNTGEQFSNCDNLKYFSALDSPDLTSITNFEYLFARSTEFNGNINDWDVSSVTDMSDAFCCADKFNQPLNDWDVSSVTDMNCMFDSVLAFNQPLNDWNVSSVTDMGYMFEYSPSFNQDLNNWDTSNVNYIVAMFTGCAAFNGNISSWNISNVDDLSSVFQDATSFNQSLNDWDVSSVTDMFSTFRNTPSFNQPLNDWDVSSVDSMTSMFRDAISFNQNLSGWDVNQVTLCSDVYSNTPVWVLPKPDFVGQGSICTP